MQGAQMNRTNEQQAGGAKTLVASPAAIPFPAQDVRWGPFLSPGKESLLFFLHHRTTCNMVYWAASKATSPCSFPLFASSASTARKTPRMFPFVEQVFHVKHSVTAL